MTQLRIYPYTVTKLFCSSCGTFRELAGTVPQRLIDIYTERHREQHGTYALRDRAVNREREETHERP